MSNIKVEFFQLLSEHGWYVSSEIKLLDILDVFKSFENDTFKEKEPIIINFYRDNLTKLESKLLIKHINRQAIIKEAFLAHKQKLYHSSTILFLSQADGLCDGKIFSGSLDDKNKYFKSKKSSYFINPTLLNKTAINENSSIEISNYYSELNRHKVMHGRISNYGNEINSLKAISFFCFVSDWFERY